MITLIDVGCAECHGYGPEPLIEARQFPTVEDAKAWVANRYAVGRPPRWLDHPQGGEHILWTSGSVWILPETLP